MRPTTCRSKRRVSTPTVFTSPYVNTDTFTWQLMFTLTYFRGDPSMPCCPRSIGLSAFLNIGNVEVLRIMIRGCAKRQITSG